MRLVAPLAVLALVGCSAPPVSDGGTGGGGGGGGGSGGGTAGPVTLEQYCAGSTLSLSCSLLTRCGLADTTAGCESFLTRQHATSTCERLRPSVKDNRIAFDGAAAGQCLQEAQTASCTPSEPASCQAIFAGQVGVDGGCYLSEDCSKGSWCDATGTTCPGRCLPRADAGTVVATNSACLEELGSTLVVDGGFFGYLCVVPAALGQPCSTGFSFRACQAGLFCNQGSCEAQRGPNAVCPETDGGALQSDLLASVFCQPNLFCQPDGTGRRVCAPAGAIGARCGTCRYDLRCAAGDGGRTCAALGLLGEGCGRDLDCRAGLFCLPDGGQLGPGSCATPAGLGTACSGSDSSCAEGLRCAQIPPTDGGFFPDRRCVAGDGGPVFGCVDPTP